MTWIHLRKLWLMKTELLIKHYLQDVRSRIWHAYFADVIILISFIWKRVRVGLKLRWQSFYYWNLSATVTRFHKIGCLSPPITTKAQGISRSTDFIKKKGQQITIVKVCAKKQKLDIICIYFLHTFCIFTFYSMVHCHICKNY